MPDTGLPMNLTIMLDTAVTNCTVKHWSIYEEHGGMIFKIRFNSIDHLRLSISVILAICLEMDLKQCICLVQP